MAKTAAYQQVRKLLYQVSEEELHWLLDAVESQLEYRRELLEPQMPIEELRRLLPPAQQEAELDQGC